MIKEAWFQRYGPHERPDTFDQIVQSWDTANKATQLSDHSVCTTWGIKGSRYYLLQVLRKQLDYPNLKRLVRDQQQAFNATVVLIEDKASGTQLIQELIEEGLHAVTRFKPEGDKVMRLHAQTATIENGFVHIPQETHWLAEYLHEVTSFPKSKYDDQVDSTSQFLSWTKQRVAGWGILGYYRQLAESTDRPESLPSIRIEAPTQISTLYTMEGRQVVPGPDGTFLVSIVEATPLLQAGWRRLPDVA